MKKIALFFGTRPEYIKILPVYKALVKRFGRKHIVLIHTKQHSDLVEKEWMHFNEQPDICLPLQRKSGSLSELIGNLMLEMEKWSTHSQEKGDTICAIVAQGDTASTYAAALHAFQSNVPFFHVEAGLRTYDMQSPYPEEFYRRSIAEIATHHFAPTEKEFLNLSQENKSPDTISVTGNTIIDHLLDVRRERNHQNVLITLHRRELGDNELKTYLAYFYQLVKTTPTWQFTWISHPNRDIDFGNLMSLSNFTLLAPISFAEMLSRYVTTDLIFTDSGGIQEEAGFLGIPCIVCRKTTERIQGIETGITNHFDPELITIDQLLASFNHEQLIEQNPIYGDGKSADRIVDVIASKIPISNSVIRK